MDIVCKKDGGGMPASDHPRVNGHSHNGFTNFAFDDTAAHKESNGAPNGTTLCDDYEDGQLGSENGASSRRINEVPDSNRTNYIQTLMHLLNGFIGSGILSMPMAFRDGGIVLATILNPIIGLMSLYCIHLLLSINRFAMKRTNTRMPYDYHEVSTLTHITI